MPYSSAMLPTPMDMGMTPALRIRVSGALVALLLGVLVSTALALPSPSGPVNDFAGVLSPGQEQTLLTMVRDVETATSAEIAVVTVSSLGGASIEEYASRLFHEWGIGRKSLDNGVLILVAPTEREMRIEVGYGLEGVLPDGLAGEIIRTDFLPRFAKGDYPGGIMAGTARIAGLVRRHHVLTPDERRAVDEETMAPNWLMVPFLGAFVALGFAGIGVGFRTRTIAPILFGVFFGGAGLALGAGAARRPAFQILGVLAAAALTFGVGLGGRRRWREAARGRVEAWSSGWVMGGDPSSASNGSVSSSGAGSSFGGGRSGGGGASGHW